MNPRLRLPLTLLLLAGFAGSLPTSLAQPSATAPAPAAVSTPSATDPFWPADGVFPVPGRTSSWAGFRAKNLQRRTLFAERQNEDRDAIVFVGDSITEGWKTLERDFADLGVKVANRGIGGDTTPNLVHRLQADVLSLNPRALVVLIGTNDLGENTAPAQIAANIKELHTRIRAAAPDIPIAWCLVMPRRGETYLERIRDLNTRLVELAKADPKSTVCDTFSALALENGSPKPDLFNPDQLHLNPAGYAAWRAAVHPIVASWKLPAK
jgi:lysophospholipase L1-like esterase